MAMLPCKGTKKDRHLGVDYGPMLVGTNVGSFFCIGREPVDVGDLAVHRMPGMTGDHRSHRSRNGRS